MRRIAIVLVSAAVTAAIASGGVAVAVNASRNLAPKCLTTAEATVLLEQKFPDDTPATPTTIKCEKEWAIGSTEGVDGVMLFQYAKLAGWFVYALGSYWGPDDDSDVCERAPKSFRKDLTGCSG